MAKKSSGIVPLSPPEGEESSTDLIAQVQTMTTGELRAELARGLTLTADTLMRLGLIWQELERRGENLSDLRQGIARTLPLIATGRLAAEAVVAFAGQALLLRALDGVPLDEQRRLAAGASVRVIDPGSPEAVQEMPLRLLPAAAVRLVFAEGQVRTPEQQRLALRPRRPRQRGVEDGYRYRPHYDPQTGMVTVGRMSVRLDDLLGAIAAAMGPDRPPAMDRPDDFLTEKVRLSREEYERFQAHCRRHQLPPWEMLRKAMRAFGLI